MKHPLLRLAAVAWLLLPLAAGCGDRSVGSAQQEMGMDWGDWGDPVLVDSDVADPTVTVLGEITTPDMLGPARIAVAPDGRIVVSDLRGQRVRVFNAHGAQRVVIPVPQPLGVAVDGAGRVFVGDVGSGSVQIFDLEGVHLGVLGAGDGEFDRPADIAWCPSTDHVFVTDMHANRVRVFTTAGAPVFDFGITGTTAGAFDSPTGIVIDDAGGRVFVADHGNARIQVFDLSGAFLDEFGGYGSSPGELNRPGGLALDSLGRLYVTDNFQSRLQVLDTDGGHVSYLGQNGHLYGQLRLTTDAVLDPYNRLLVTSYKTRKVVIFGIDDFSQPPPEIQVLAANTVVAPATLVPMSRAFWVSLYIEIPGGDPMAIQVDTVRIGELARAPGSPITLGDHDEDGVPDLMLKFDNQALRESLAGPGEYELPVTGQMGEQVAFEGVAHVTLGERRAP